MKIKKYILFLTFLLLLQLSYKIFPVSAQDNKDSLEIKKVIEVFLRDTTNRDIESAMQWISVNYSDIGEIDYAEFRSELEKLIKNMSKKYIDESIDKMETIQLDIQDDKANVEITYDWKAFNLDTFKEDRAQVRRAFTFAWENDSWKIIRCQRLRYSE